MPFTPVRLAAAVAVAAIALTACGSEALNTGQNQGAPETSRPTEQTTAADKRADRKKATEQTADRKKPRGATATQPQGDSGGQQDATGPRPAGSTRTATAARSNCMADATGDQDAAGSPPAYTDIVRACLRLEGSTLTWTTTLSGSAPTRQPSSEENLSLGLALDRGAGSASHLIADAGPNGWTAYVTDGSGRRALPGAVTIDGSTVRVRMSLTDAGGLRWRAESSWTRSTLLATHYAFDSAPDQGNAGL